MYKFFSKEQRSSFSYWFAHFCAFNMTALVIGRWKFKYLFHDWEKPWLMLIWGGNYKRVQKWHREHRNHHIEYFRKHGSHKTDFESLAIDWECSGLTKKSSPRNATDALNDFIPILTTEYGLTQSQSLIFIINMTETLKSLGIYTPTTYFSNPTVYNNMIGKIMGDMNFVIKTDMPVSTFLSERGYTLLFEGDHRNERVFVSEDGKTFLMKGSNEIHSFLLCPDKKALDDITEDIIDRGYTSIDVTDNIMLLLEK